MKYWERLVDIREQNGYTRKMLSDELGIPYKTISNYETGEREPGHGYIVLIANKFNVSTDYILGISDISEKNAPPISGEAMKLANDYDHLDPFGKKQVRSVTDNELARVAAQQPALDRLSQLEARMDNIEKAETPPPAVKSFTSPA